MTSGTDAGMPKPEWLCRTDTVAVKMPFLASLLPFQGPKKSQFSGPTPSNAPRNGRGDVDEGKVLYTRLGNTAAHTYTIDVCMCDSVILTGQ